MTFAGLVLGALAGAIVGSFLANLMIRFPKGEQVLVGRSRCDQCGRPLRVVDLLPIVSRLMLRGRCSACGGAIDPLHWRVEACAAAIGAAALGLSLDWPGLAAAVFGWLLLPLAWLDWRHYWLPDRLVAVLAAAGLAFGGLLGPSLADRLVGGIIAWGALSFLLLAYRRLRGREGLGQGDPKLFGAIGLWLGWTMLAPILALAAALGLAVALARGLSRTDALPFGTMLAVAAWVFALGFLYPPLSILS